ncbi:type II secretion system protein N [Luteimonas deserti]|uniref:PDZ domain-containing protein n=1 Tax=Luteimonas deserti TaxID=2752306 RepID=A0A7Z0QS76_9GAMM|nr:type II secretion system protein N [Luteimonas deserti]NYZ63912.1 PDZ domain-containing protein [Luteimonas deserti]
MLTVQASSASFRHWPTLAETALWLLLLAQLVRFGWWMLAPQSVAGTPLVYGLPAQVPTLAGQDPFFGGTAPAAATASGWRLFGLRTGVAGTGTAILAHEQGPQAVYRVGDVLAPGLVLAAVRADHVELDNGQRLELPGNAAAPTPASAVPAPVSALPAAAIAAPASVDPARLLDAGLQPRNENGRITGYTLLPRGNSEVLLRAAGLQPGDVLLSVNGQVLSPSVIAELAGELKANPQAVVTFERDGQTRTLDLGRASP